MPTPAKRRPTATAITGGEGFVLVVLLLIAAGGGWIATQHLAALRLEAGLHPLKAAPGEASPAEAAPADDVPAPANAAAPETASVEPEPARSGPPTTAAAALPVRTQSLLVIGDLISKRILVETGPPIQSAAMAARGGQGLPGYAVGPDGKLAAGFGPLFGLGDADLAALQSAAYSIKERADALVLANATIQETGPDAYSIQVNPAAEAAALRSEFESSFRGILGDTGFKAFALLNGERELPAGRAAPAPPGRVVPLSGVAAMFNGFGADTKTITVSKSGGRYTFQVQSGVTNARGTAAPTTQVLESRLGPLTKLLPPGF